MTNSVSSEQPFGSVGQYVEQFRKLADSRFIDSAVVGAVEGALVVATSAELFMAYARHALSAASIVRGEVEAARVAEDRAVADRAAQVHAAGHNQRRRTGYGAPC